MGSPPDKQTQMVLIQVHPPTGLKLCFTVSLIDITSYHSDLHLSV